MSDDLMNRLRGQYEVGPDAEFGKRQFPVAPIQIEAADRIAALEAELSRWRALDAIPDGYAIGDDETARLAVEVSYLEADLATADEVRNGQVVLAIQARIKAEAQSAEMRTALEDSINWHLDELGSELELREEFVSSERFQKINAALATDAGKIGRAHV